MYADADAYVFTPKVRFREMASGWPCWHSSFIHRHSNAELGSFVLQQYLSRAIRISVPMQSPLPFSRDLFSEC